MAMDVWALVVFFVYIYGVGVMNAGAKCPLCCLFTTETTHQRSL